MSEFKKWPWFAVSEALYWRFVDRHADFFRSNPRMAVMVGMRDTMGTKLAEPLRGADAFLAGLH